MKVFVLQHEHELDGRDEVNMIGVYGSEPEAVEARERMRRLPGFRDHPDGFSIDAYALGHDHWTTGFISEAVETVRATGRAA